MSEERIFKNNLLLNIKEIKDKKTVLLSRPRKLNVALTNRCNISCIMCEPKKISWEIHENVIREIISLFPYLERIIWQGGEVFLFDSFKEILQEAARFRNITHEITTNAHLITQGWIEAIKKINLDLNISIDAFSPGLYEYIRAGSKFNDLMRSLDLINQSREEGGSKVLVLIFTVMKSNFQELENVIGFAKRFNFSRVIIQPVKGNYDNEENIFYRNNIEALQYIEKIKPRLKKDALSAGIHLVEWLPTSPETNSAKKDEKKNCLDTELFCNAPWGQLFIEWGGSVYPHCLCVADGPNEKRSVGNVLKEPLLEIWNNEKMQLFRKKIADNDYQDLCNADCVCGLITGDLRNLPVAEHLAIKEFKETYPQYIRELRDRNNQGDYENVAREAEELKRLVPEDDGFYQNKLLSEQEIAQKKIIVSAKMRNLIVTLSTACNLNCVMCEERRLNWQIPGKLLSEVVASFPFLERLVWQGGEVFLIDYFEELVEEAGKFPNLRQVITTNGLLIDEEWAEKLVKSNVDITFSIDGTTREVYEKIREGAKFDVLMRNLLNFNQARKRHNKQALNTNLHTVVMKSNYHQLEGFVDFAKEHGFTLLALLPIGGNFRNPENIFHAKDEEALAFIAKTIPKVKEKAKKYGVLLENRLPAIGCQEPAKSKEPESVISNIKPNNKLLCHLPWIQVYIDYDGTIRPDCVCRPEKSIGNAACDSLAEAWNNEKMQQYRRLLAKNRCEEICNPECYLGQVSERYLKFS